jgi:hypothetical protein
MLDSGGRQADIAQWIFSLPCHVQFPPKLREELERSGAVPVPSDDVRRHRRIFCRGEKHRAALELRQTLPALPRATNWQCVYTSDFSKSGCGFIHSSILYPGERVRMVLLTGSQRCVRITWCRRLDNSCYAVGGQFVIEPSGQAGEE